MALIVQKFGGTSVGSIERIQNVAERVLDTQAQGHDVAVVVSAMSGETNRLVALATAIDPIPFSLEYDMLLASGEQVSVALVSLAINREARRRGLIGENDHRARPFLGHQLGIQTDSVFSKARIKAIDHSKLMQVISQKVIPVIAGFQGVDGENNITTMGRGGSDTSAVAIAAAIKADTCEILTDVDGVYTTDPRLCPEAKKIPVMAYEEMMELASVGAKVLQIRSVELAANHGVKVHVRSSFNQNEGTWVVAESKMAEQLQKLGVSKMEEVVVAGVASDKAQVKFALQNLPDKPGVVARIFGALSQAEVVVDIIVQTAPSNGLITLAFSVGMADSQLASQVLLRLQKEQFPQMKIETDNNLAKLSIVGVGMAHHPGVAARFFEILARHEINLLLVTTSEIKISALIAEKHLAEAVKFLHQGFELERVS